MDFIVKLPLSNGYDSILTVTDHDCTKAALFIPCNEAITAEGLAELYLQHVFKRFGLPKKIISDCDPRIAGEVHKGAMHGTWDCTEHIHGISSLYGWTVRAYKSRSGAVSPLLC